MKRTKRLFLVLALGGAGALVAASALAVQTFHGTICQPFAINTSVYGPAQPKIVSLVSGIESVESTSSLDFTCPTPVPSIGTTNVTWQVVVNDASSTKGVECIGIVTDNTGAIVAATSSVNTGTTYTGSSSFSLSTTSGGFSSSYALEVGCNLPPFSLVNSIAVL